MASSRRISGSHPNTRARTVSQGPRRASDAPTPRWIIDCVLITSTPRTRNNHVSGPSKPAHGHEQLPEGTSSMHQETLPNEESAEQGCDSAASTQDGEPKKLSQRITRSRDRSLADADTIPSTSRTKAHTSISSPGPAQTPWKRPRRREGSASTDSEESSAQLSIARASARTHAPRDSPSKARDSSRTSDEASPVRPSASVSQISKMKGKGKGKASNTAYEMSLSLSALASASTEHVYGDASSSSSESRRDERWRPSPPAPSPSFDLDEPAEDGEDGLRSAAEDDFQMLEGPESLPWVPFDPTSKDSEYVPPRVNALMEDMKRALVANISALQKAEHGLSEERERRRALEHEVARLATVNHALRAERSAWASAAAETLAASLESALVSDIARRLAADSASPRYSAVTWPVQIAEKPSYPSQASGSGSAPRSLARGAAGEADGDVDVNMADGANSGGGSTARMHHDVDVAPGTAATVTDPESRPSPPQELSSQTRRRSPPNERDAISTQA